MKKIVLIIVCVLATVGAKGQSHSFRGDTSYVKYMQFDYDAWVMEDTLHHGKIYSNCPTYPRSTTSLGCDDVLQYNYTDNPAGLEVVGLSAAIALSPFRLDSNVTPEYLLLYESTPDTFELKARVRWLETDTAGRPFFTFMSNVIPTCEMVSTGLIHNTFQDSPNAHLFRVFDYYFDKPITVYDSFYVGGTDYGIMPTYTHENIPESETSYITFRPTYAQFYDTCYTISLWKMYHYTTRGVPSLFPLLQWHWVPSNQFLMILPIIAVVDTTFNAPPCPEVAGLFVLGNYTDTVMVQWAQDSLHDEFELSYGREGIAPEDGTIVTLHDTTRWQFTDTSYSDTPMVAYVRTVCREYDTLRWGEWGSVRWRLHHEVDTSHSDTTHHEGIEVPDDRSDLSRFVRLMPNPASGSVVVMSSYGIDGLEVYDVRGEQVLELSGVGRGTSAGFDVTGWTKGTYVVSVRTPAGTIAKRLVVN